MTRKIAYTGMGRNALVAGLICHIGAILSGMMPAAGAGLLFKIIYPFSCLFLISGACVELYYRSGHPFRTGRFYLIVAVSVFPLLGPLIVLGLLYHSPTDGQEARGNWSGLFSAMLKLRANGWIIFALLILLFLLFAGIHSKNDPYYKQRVPKSQSAQLILNTVPQVAEMRIVILTEGEESC